ncbi:MAG: response regulator transcription factor [Flavobacteriaceae bacterium]|nr:response regulator transcription factor [Flavobacteriaceae bacterium]
MGFRHFSITFFLLIITVLFPMGAYTQNTAAESQKKVSLRMIGHQVLLSSKDSTSRVLPIKKEGDLYRIEFEGAFGFVPEELVATIDRVAKETHLATRYIVEVAHCNTGEVVYSFKMDEMAQSDIIPCQSRIQEKACYILLFTILDAPTEEALVSGSGSTTKESGGMTSYTPFVIGAFFLLIALLSFLVWRRSKKIAHTDPNLIALGEYQFDKRNTELLIQEQRIELTSKEADLLLLLYNEANTTVERERILNRVWGDEGDYVGRTLDVFISKLRKKLEFDSKVKIVNIRGVGYKLVVEL